MTSAHRTAAAVLAAGLAIGGAAGAEEARPPALSYAADRRMEFPKDYRTWVYLSSGMDMAYVEGGGGAMHAFDNVFVDPAAYAAFQKTGTWPDKTVMVLEVRGAEQNGSINKSGRFQANRMGVEVHVKDAGRFKSGWAFFGFNGEAPAQALPQSSACNVCHQDHAAVDTTFVQFYPTLFGKAKEMKTLSAAYLAEEAARSKAVAAR